MGESGSKFEWPQLGPAGREAAYRPGPPTLRGERLTADAAVRAPIEVLLLRWRRDVAAGAARNTTSEDGRFHLSRVPAAGLDEVAASLAARAPRLVVIDASLAEAIGPQPLRHLQHAHLPQQQWLIGWDGPAQHWIHLLVQLELRGCIEWRSDDAGVARACAAVADGELWFPRCVMQWLYLSARNSLRVPGAAATQDALEHLTERESQVLLLMREGLTNKEIARRLQVSVNTVKKHLAHAFEKRGLHHRRQLLARDGMPD